jgi:cupin domain/tRNA synthetase class I (M)
VWIRKFDLSAFEPMGECRWQLLYPWDGVVKPPFWSGWTHLKPGERTKKHQHHEFETYFVAQGRGEMRVNEERIAVGPGDVLFMPPFNDHVLLNTSETEEVLFLSVFWEDMPGLAHLAAESSAHPEKRVLLTATPGAAARAAEVHARYLEMRGVLVRRAFDDPGSSLSPEVARAARELAERLLDEGRLAVRALPAPHLAFPMAPYAAELREYYLSANLGPRVRAVGERLLVEGLPEIAVSAPGTEGVPAPGLEGQVLSADFLAVAALLAAGEQDAWEGFWDSAEGSTVQFFAPEEIERFAIRQPALLLAAHPGIRLPRTLVVADAPDEVTAEGPGVGTAATPADIAQWRAWLSELAERVAQERGGAVPATGFWMPEQRRFYKRLLQLVQEAAHAYEAPSFAPEEIGRLLADLVWATRRFAESERAWIGVPDRQNERRTSLALELLAAKILAMVVAPLAPELGASLARALGAAATGAPPRWEEIPDWVPPGFQIGDLDIDDSGDMGAPSGATAPATPAVLAKRAEREMVAR